MVFDLTSRRSLERAEEWVRELHENADADIVIALVGNKSDLVEQRVVSTTEAMALARDHGLLYFECSAKSGAGVADAFVETSKLSSAQDPGRQRDQPVGDPGLRAGRHADAGLRPAAEGVLRHVNAA